MGPTEEDLGLLMSSVVVNVRIYGREGGKRDGGEQARGLKMGQLTLSMGPARAAVSFLLQRATIPSKRVIFYICKHHKCI
jgi:hypothetical protein